MVSRDSSVRGRWMTKTIQGNFFAVVEMFYIWIGCDYTTEYVVGQNSHNIYHSYNINYQ